MALQVGDIIEGKVTGIKPFGAFVSLPEGKNGLVHISEVSYEYVQDIATVLKEGQAVSVKVLSIAPDGKIALSIKRTQPAPQRTGHQGGAAHGAPQRQQRQKKEAPPRVWQPKPPAPQNNLSFEDMMARFKSRSEGKNRRPQTGDRKPPRRVFAPPRLIESHATKTHSGRPLPSLSA